MQSYGNRLAAFRKVLLSDSEVRPGDRLALLGPVTHASGMLVQPNLFRGTELVLFERFDPAEFLDSVGRHGLSSPPSRIWPRRRLAKRESEFQTE